ncbi:ribose/galactose/methyl galactoside import ATP-binding protein [Clostridium aceticum]|uniref:Ribose/galactose/methyl galactoside import ATP-binding protein n=1 Tax=Clostridium aceticum TaxID=84022 RepID=A0A0G3W7E8_9CLOT|nr:sugar ABC transporter ATP-binding protein [Clostridium aceticum]AKL94278.1 ribose/galactose/methyl galactoside import ATP-binding protein [Clostridium aceticum]
MEDILKIENLTKKFEENYALKDVNFSLKKGEIHGLVGANGSGKSTLMNILFGSSHIKDTGGYSGRIFIEEENITISSTLDALKHGIGLVHQEFALLGNLDISSNIKINRENIYPLTGKVLGKKFGIVDTKKNKEDAKNALSKIGVNIDPGIKVNNVSINMKQFIEIAREIDNTNLKILMLDEPSASLNQEDTKILLKSLRAIADTGISIIFVSHRLEEVTQICDRVTVLRDGEVISHYTKEVFEINKIALDMIGMQVVQTKRKRTVGNKDNIISFQNVQITQGDKLYKEVSLDIKKGEVLGITGLAGYGQEIFGYGLMGLYDMKGSVLINGEKVIPGDVGLVSKKGIYMLPDERKEMGLLLGKSIWENIVFGSYEKHKEFLKYPKMKGLSFLNHSVIHNYSNKLVKDLNIKTKDIYQPIKELSGGNQQKVCIGRALTMNPDLLFVGEPTRGIDIYSKEIVLKMLLKMNEEKGMTIVISSGEIGELKRICDRIVIMYEGEVFDILEPDIDDEVFSLAISGRRVEGYEKS